MIGRPGSTVWFIVVCTLWAGPGAAQSATSRAPRHRLEVNVGGLWLASVPFADADAELTRNQGSGTPYTQFETSSRVASAPAFEARIGARVTHTLSVEGAFTYARPALRTSISSDAEGIPAVEARETLEQIAVEASAVVHLRRFRIGRAVPFVLGGGGYLRDVHEGRTLVENGGSWHAGGGAKLVLSERRGLIKTFGVRMDARVRVRSGGADLDPSKPARASVVAGASLMLGF